MVKIGDIVTALYDNGESVNGEVVKVNTFSNAAPAKIAGRTLVTVKAEQGYRSIYLDKCVNFFILENI